MLPRLPFRVVTSEGSLKGASTDSLTGSFRGSFKALRIPLGF